MEIFDPRKRQLEELKAVFRHLIGSGWSPGKGQAGPGRGKKEAAARGPDQVVLPSRKLLVSKALQRLVGDFRPLFFQVHCFHGGKGWVGLNERVEKFLQSMIVLRDLRKIHNELFRDTSLWSKLHRARQLNTNWNSKIASNSFSSCTLLTIAASCLTFLRHFTPAPIVTLWMDVESDAENDVRRWMCYACLKIWGGGGKIIH